MSSGLRDEEGAIKEIDGMIRDLSGGSANPISSQQIHFNDSSIENVGGDGINITNELQDVDIDIEQQAIRYQTIRLFAKLGEQVSDGVDGNEEDIQETLGMLAKIGAVAGFGSNILNIASKLGLEVPPI